MIRAGVKGGVFALADGSRIEMGPRTELSLATAREGTRIRLTSGTVLVTAAKQPKGRLYVDTWDCVVSVVGTVFTVNAEQSGSRVSVIEGKVHVQRGEEGQVLLPGEQVSTTPELLPVPLSAEVSWSPQVEVLAALLQQSTAPAPPVPPAAPETRGAIQGIVTLEGQAVGIEDVTVTACRTAALGYTPEYTTQKVPLEWRFQNGEYAGPITRNKTYFFALWDNAAGGAPCSEPALTATTDRSGRFAIRDLPLGQYTVRIHRDGYLPSSAASASNNPASLPRQGLFRYYESQLPLSTRAVSSNVDARTVTLEAQSPSAEVSANLIRGTTISGRVRDIAGRLLPNVTVQVGTLGPDGATLNVVLSATTDDRGDYRLFWLLPGEYFVTAGPPSTGFPLTYYVYSNRAAATPGTSAPPPTPSRTFYPSAASVKEAVPVVVREGGELPGIDITLR
jgi:hypothetical protein